MTSKILVLDLNIIESAATGLNTEGQVDDTCIGLLRTMLSKYHKLAVSSSVWKKYRQTVLSMIRNDVMIFGGVISFLGISSAESDKVIRLIDSNHKIADLDECKNKLVNLAIDARALFVTQDQTLAEKVRNLEIVSPSTALTLISLD